MPGLLLLLLLTQTRLQAIITMPVMVLADLVTEHHLNRSFNLDGILAE